MTLKTVAMTGLIAATACIAGCEKKAAPGAAGGAPAGAAERCLHEIKQEKCPFCTPSLVESEGFCGEHGVAEALCVACRPYLKAAFRAKGDWCGEHDTAESQCVQCHPELKEKIKPGIGHGAKG
jgi:cobalt-zinc-cadmium efflux system membrane fusion protein